LLNWPPSQFGDLHLLVFDAKTAKKVNDVPSGFTYQWAADGDYLWTIDTVYSRQGEACGVACRLWPAHAPSAPWWLIGGTVLALPIAARSMWHIRRGSAA
jgi:hypothetical protein